VWVSAGHVGPAERDNVTIQSGFEQGIAVWEHGSWFLVPFVGVTLGTDSLGYEWNDKHPATVAVKLVRRVPGGVVQAGGGVLFERDPRTERQAHATAFVNYWAGWTADRRAHRGAFPNGFPGHVAASSGLLTGRDPDNWITTVWAQQGVVVLKNRFVAAVPYMGGTFSVDTARRPWENRATLDTGIKLVRALRGGVLEAGIAERTQRDWLTGRTQSAPIGFVNLWLGWNPRSASLR
jgi:hypothetical protein